MDHGTLALMVPIMALSIPFFAIWTKHQRRIEEIRARTQSEIAAQASAQTARLEERVRVLERILTDRGTSLAAEIDALRLEESQAPATPAAKLQ